MTDEAADLSFFAMVNNDIHRSSEAIHFFKQLIALKPALDRAQRANLLHIYKSALDRLRRTVNILSEHLRFERLEKNSSICERIESIRDRCRAELSGLCNEAVDLVDRVLLPNADGRQAEVFFHRFRGDVFRYLVERANDNDRQEFLSEAKKSYVRGIELGAELPLADPVALGTILNYAVFVREHERDVAAALEMVTSAVAAARDRLSSIDESERAETRNVITQMDADLRSWQEEEEEIDEEEEEDAANK
jgi:14-3-3 protein epsilon